MMSLLVDGQLAQGGPYLQQAAADSLRHRVEVAVEGKEAIAGETSAEGRQRKVGSGGQWSQQGFLFLPAFLRNLPGGAVDPSVGHRLQPISCLLYTSDAADDLLCVDL